jgi:anti-sigma-K factor RskA
MNRAGEPGHELPDADLRELAAAYALGALDEFERARFERALAGSAELQADVEAFRATAASLGEAVEPVTPPPALKDRLFARLDDVTQEPAAPAAAPAPDTTAAAPAPETLVAPTPTPAVSPPSAPTPDAVERETFGGDTLTPAGTVDELAARRRRRRLAVALSSAAAAVLIAAGVVFGVNWPGPNGWGAQREFAQLAQAADSQTKTIETADGGEVTLVWSEEQGRSAVRAEDLPDVGDDRTYELWYIDDSGAVPAGTFDVRGDSDAWRLLEGEFAPGVVVGITVEPAGGSEQPTTEPIAAIPT